MTITEPAWKFPTRALLKRGSGVLTNITKISRAEKAINEMPHGF
jgi:hypothetical protein